MAFFLGDLVNSTLGFTQFIFGFAVILLGTWLYFSVSRANSSKYHLPPGPKGEPILGNLRQINATRCDIQFANWSKEFSKRLLFLRGPPCYIYEKVQRMEVV